MRVACCPTPSSRSLPRGKSHLDPSAPAASHGQAGGRWLENSATRPSGLCAWFNEQWTEAQHKAAGCQYPASRGNAEPTNNSASRTSTLRVRTLRAAIISRAMKPARHPRNRRSTRAASSCTYSSRGKDRQSAGCPGAGPPWACVRSAVVATMCSSLISELHLSALKTSFLI